MDLAMILSPAPDEAAAAGAGSPEAAPATTGRSYSSDELQCAVAILTDFQQPAPGRAAATPDRAASPEPRGPAAAATATATATPSKLDLLVQADAELTRRTPTVTSGGFLRSGVWTRAEEEYAAALMYYFLKGMLSLAEGTTLRKFLAEQLCCNRRRVSMKLATEALAHKKIPRKVGASVFVALDPPPSDAARREMELILAQLRRQSFRSAAGGATPGPDGPRGQPRGHDLPLEEILQDAPQLQRHESDESDETEDERSVAAARATARPVRRPAADAPKRKRPTIIRTGFATPEEDEYVTAMCDLFLSGALALADGTKLVHYLCEQLQCSPKTLSMKLAPRRLGERKFPDNVGALTYLRQVSSEDELFEAESRLRELRLAYEDARSSATERPQQPESPPPASTAPRSASASPARVFSRSGPWSREEEVFAASLIDCFFQGVLELAEGTTLRAFLAARLRCNPMRVSKKLASECIADVRIPKKLGSSTFVRRGAVTSDELQHTERALRGLQLAYLHADGHSQSHGHSQSAGRKRRRRAQAADPDATESEDEGDTRRRTQPRRPVPADAPERVLPAPLREQLA